MTDQPTTIYTLYPVFKATPDFRVELAGTDDLRDAVQEVENLYKAWEGRVASAAPTRRSASAPTPT